MTQMNTKLDINTIITSRGTANIEITRAARTIPGIRTIAQEYRAAWAAYYQAQSELGKINERLCDDMNRAFHLVNPVRENDVEEMIQFANTYATSTQAWRIAVHNAIADLKARMIASVKSGDRNVVVEMFASALSTGEAIANVDRYRVKIRDIQAELTELAI